MMRAPQKMKQLGFTLIELMVAIAVSAMVFLSVFAIIRSGVDTQMYVREMSDAGRQGPAILQQIADDLENLYFYNIYENDMFIGKMIENGDNRADRMHFLTTRPSLLADANIATDEDDFIGHPSPLSEVSWLLKPSENNEEFWELHRREQNFVDEEIDRGGYYRMITDRIISFKVQYTGWELVGGGVTDSFGDLAGGGDESSTRRSSSSRESDTSTTATDEESSLLWDDEWDALERGGLPVAIKIEMIISPDLDPQVMDRMRRDGREAELDQHYISIVLLPQFREDAANMKSTFAWDGTVAEPFQTGGAAGAGAGGPGAGAGGGRRGGENGEGGSGGGRGGRGNNGGNQPGTNNGGTSSPFLDAIRGGSSRGNAGGLLGGSNK